MRVNPFVYGLNKDKGDPSYICPVCNNKGLLFDPSANSLDSLHQLCRCCGYRDNPNFKDGAAKWRDAWLACGGEYLFDKDNEDRMAYYSKIYYAFYSNYFYVVSDEEIEKKVYDEKLFTQYGFIHNEDSSKIITVRSEDGKSWKFDYVTNKLYCLDNEDKYFAVAEDSGRYFLFASEYLCESGANAYRGFYTGFVPDMFGLYFPIDRECVLLGKDRKNYFFNIEQK